jgi:hypothetical protein
LTVLVQNLTTVLAGLTQVRNGLVASLIG